MDRRDMCHQWFQSFDEKAMTVTIEEFDNGGDELIDLVVPVKFDVCDTCEGKGRHVNPSIDAHGITAEEFGEDPDFREDYFNGHYDQDCNECHGRRVTPVLDEDRCTPELKAQVEAHIEGYYSARAEEAHERRMGY